MPLLEAGQTLETAKESVAVVALLANDLQTKALSALRRDGVV